MSEPDSLARKLERAMRIYYSLSYTNDLRPAQWQALRFFAEAPADKRSLADFAHARASTMGTASITVSKLVERGFLERAHQHRNVDVRITEQGRQYLEKGDPAKGLAWAIDDLPPQERQALDIALDRIIESLEPTGNTGC